IGDKDKVNKNYIQYIQVNSGKIEWSITPSLVVILSNGKWSIRNYELINSLILEFLLRQYPSNENIESDDYIRVLNYLTPRAKILYNNIKQLSNKNIGALMVILKQNKSRKKTIYKQLLSKQSLSKNEFTKIIQTDKKNQINIYNCDTYLFELIASVDGAILLDKNFNILSFGEMINNSIPTPEVAEAGSRTLAAAKASIFGLSIKVSEDGDISIFEDGSPVNKL
ncbi:diadenylate cyclase, partial [Neobacillus niacini]|uniref:diadenylate cyclase n=1 Tax=Neobacillus niacini TaxID=86668 RepID=UPI002FFDE4A9